MKTLWYACRRLLRNPVATAVAVLSLGLGIGANSAIFSLYEALVLRPLPVRAPNELVFVRSHHPLFGEGRNISYPLYKDLSTHLTSLSGLAAKSAKQLNLNAGGNSERVFGEFVTENYYEVLGVVPVHGRVFTDSDASNSVAVLLYQCWRQRFGSDPAIIGKKIFLNSKPFTIIGITAPDFRGTETGTPVDIQVPATMATEVMGGPDRLKQPRISWLEAIGRLKSGISPTTANAEIQQVYRDLRNPNIAGPDRLQLIAAPRGISVLRSTYAEQLTVLLAIAAGVLLLTCLNLSNFLFARVFARRQESAVLVALGAQRGELARQPFAESVLLAAVGTVLGLVTAVPLAHGLLLFFPKLANSGSLGSLIDWRVFGFSVSAALICALVIAVYPALWNSLRAPSDLLRESNSTIAGGRSASRIGRILLALQVMIATILVLATVLFVGTLQALEHTDTGFAGHNLILASLDPPSSGYDLQRTQEFYTELLDRVRATPGVLNAALSRLVVLSSGVDSNTICVDDYHPGHNEKMEQNINTISSDYFSTLGVPFLAGRDFSKDDTAKSPRVAIINQRMAKGFWGMRNPLGHRIGIGCDDPKNANIEIVGVVGDARYDSLRDVPSRLIYIPYLQNDENLRLTLNVSTRVGVDEMISSLRHQTGSLDANVPLYEVRTLQDQMDQSLWREHMLARLSAFFSVLALLLAGLGVYSILNYNIQNRKKEIGLRLSLGASTAAVVGLILRDTFRWAIIGLAVGIPAGLMAIRFASSLIYNTTPLDLRIIGTTSVVIIMCACFAAFIPLVRITQIDPAQVLRSE